jgi:zinc transporter ZupT
MAKVKLVAGRIFGAVVYVACLVAAIGIWIFCIAADPLLGVLLGWIPGFIIFCVLGQIEDRAALKSEGRYRDELTRAHMAKYSR